MTTWNTAATPAVPKPDSPTREAPTDDEARIDESIDESFPASDPPAVHPSGS